jgi:hypothetical protein
MAAIGATVARLRYLNVDIRSFRDVQDYYTNAPQLRKATARDYLGFLTQEGQKHLSYAISESIESNCRLTVAETFRVQSGIVVVMVDAIGAIANTQCYMRITDVKRYWDAFIDLFIADMNIRRAFENMPDGTIERAKTIGKSMLNVITNEPGNSRIEFLLQEVPYVL